MTSSTPEIKYDLHSHSTASDGALTPTQLVTRAREAGIDCLALTDHDSTAGLAEAAAAARDVGIKLVKGIELSVTWESRCFHIVGLHIDPACPDLVEGLSALGEERTRRARNMADKLEKCGISNCFDGASRLAGEGMLTRTHFARYLLEQGHVSTPQQAFDRYLKPGRPGYVKTSWADLEDAVAWIRAAGGMAVVAHPMRYKLTGSWMRRFLDAFCRAGGEGIEIVTGNGTMETVRNSARYAREFGLLGSAGSDFHTPEARWISFGTMPPLPDDITPVWEKWPVR